MSDTITRRDAFHVLDNCRFTSEQEKKYAYSLMEQVASADVSDDYAKAVWAWLLDYQIKAAELKGRYTPYEVLSWVVNDWRKEHERYDKQMGGQVDRE